MEASIEKTSEFKRGVQSGLSIAIGYFPIALAFGLLSKTTGLTLFETVLMSLAVFAGASQYMSLSLFASGAGAFVIIFTTFVVNIRHFLMSASLNEKVEKENPIIKSLYAFGITDETFSVMATKDGKVSTGFAFGVIGISYASWVVNSGIGYVIGASLPQVLQESMTVALYAMFIGLLVPSLKKSMKVVYLAVLAAAFNSIFIFSKLLEDGWAIVISTILSAIIVELAESIKRRKRGNES
ncbi:AzlC family ABC transporter permease [Bacillus sp. FJAT-49736]|uniref:AzlC family ABC transporter permease n=1 Tax=Bacillus sp. FJAT-49736 TaxID=2833582 RepID=UPI001BC9C488|nr:AzlC family ABC transporter permease [Bacillus sp. FJAT-49736]MBS4171982.1 AzlC family ABC transporter permease [Bacillus sp. FJAT-49736]